MKGGWSLWKKKERVKRIEREVEIILISLSKAREFRIMKLKTQQQFKKEDKKEEKEDEGLYSEEEDISTKEIKDYE